MIEKSCFHSDCRAKPQKVLSALVTRDIEEVAAIAPGMADFLIRYPIAVPMNTSNVAPIFADLLGATLQNWTSSNERCVCTERRKPGQTKADYRALHPTFVPQDVALAFDRPIVCGICERSKIPCSTFVACLTCKRMVCAWCSWSDVDPHLVVFDGSPTTQGFNLQRPSFANAKRDGLPEGLLLGHVRMRSEEQAKYRMNDVLGVDPTGKPADIEESPQEDEGDDPESEEAEDAQDDEMPIIQD